MMQNVLRRALSCCSRTRDVVRRNRGSRRGRSNRAVLELSTSNDSRRKNQRASCTSISQGSRNNESLQLGTVDLTILRVHRIYASNRHNVTFLQSQSLTCSYGNRRSSSPTSCQRASECTSCINSQSASGSSPRTESMRSNVLISQPIHTSRITSHQTSTILLADLFVRHEQTFQAINNRCTCELLDQAGTVFALWCAFSGQICTSSQISKQRARRSTRSTNDISRGILCHFVAARVRREGLSCK